MNMTISPQEGAALWRMLSDTSSDIIVRTDSRGFILNASPAIAGAGASGGGELFGRHLLDLVEPSQIPLVRDKLERTSCGLGDEGWGEVAVPWADGASRWFEIRMQAVPDYRQPGHEGGPAGVLAILRSIDERKAFERQLFVATMTDALTGLSNRSAFTQMLGHLIDGEGGSIAIFNIDHFKAINLRYGHSVGDEVLVVFADYVRTALREKDIISRIGGETLGVLFPGTSPAQAETISARIVRAIAEISSGGGRGSIPITTSAGVARIGETVDDTIRRAEVALALAKAKGRNRLEMEAG